jgi:hypothetical protein
MIISQVKLINNKCRLAIYAKHARYLNQHILVIINLWLSSNCNKHNHKSHMNIGEMTLLWNDSNEQVSPISEGFVDINLYLVRKKPYNMMYAQSLGPYIWLPFTKSLHGRNCSSTLGMKSRFHNDHSTVAIILGYLILPPTTIIE